MMRSKTIATTLALAWAIPGQAADYVVYQGENPDVAVARVVVVTSKSPSSLQPVDLDAHRASLGPTYTGIGSMTACGGAATSTADVGTLLEEAEGALGFMEVERAQEVLGKAIGMLGCLDGPMVAQDAGRLYFLMGIAGLANEDKPAAWESFSHAWTLHPGIEWDDNFPPEMRPVFLAAKAEIDATQLPSLQLVPEPGESYGLWMDGQAIDAGSEAIGLAGAEHVLQWQHGGSFQTNILRVEAGVTPGLVFASELPEGVAYWIGNENRKDDLAVLLSTVGRPGETVYLTTLGGVWKTEIGQMSWEELSPATESAPAVADEDLLASATSTDKSAPGSRSRSGPSLLQSGVVGVGGTLVAVGGYRALNHYTTARGMIDMASCETEQGCVLAEGETTNGYNGEVAALNDSYVVLGLGAALTTTGLLLLDGGSGPLGLRPWLDPLSGTWGLTLGN
ncbi:MAG: hypothetical protein QGG40_02125 [Myxococcota bacterium]|nr:hypothetical protein [Myxococcota bacterium]